MSDSPSGTAQHGLSVSRANGLAIAHAACVRGLQRMPRASRFPRTSRAAPSVRFSRAALRGLSLVHARHFCGTAPAGTARPGVQASMAVLPSALPFDS